MASEVDISNLALAHLGNEATVASIDPPEGSAQADHCARFYPVARDQVLALHAWAFNTKRLALAVVDTDETPDEWAYCYAVPAGCLNVVAIYAPGGTDTAPQPFIQETLSDGTAVIYANVEDAYCRYTCRITDTSKFPPLVVTAIARLLAAYLAGPVIKGDAGRKESQAHMGVFMKADLPLATATDARAQKVNVYNNTVPDALLARQ